MKNQILMLIVLFSVLSAVWSFDCPHDNGYFRHPTDHHKFYLCVNGHEYEYTCPTTTVWNQLLHRCDFDEGPTVDPTTEAIEIPHGTRPRHTFPTTTTETLCDTEPSYETSPPPEY